MKIAENVLLPPNSEITIPVGEAGRHFLRLLPTHVAPRQGGRTNAERERYCVVQLLRHLAVTSPSMLPAKLRKAASGGSPDFVLIPDKRSKPIGIEQTDAGEQEFQAWQDTQARQRSITPTNVVSLPSPSGLGWSGDEPEQAFAAALEVCIANKSAEKTWRDAPDASRCLLVYDNTNTGSLVSDLSAQQILDRVAAPALRQMLDCVVLIRDPDSLLLTGSLI